MWAEELLWGRDSIAYPRFPDEMRVQCETHETAALLNSLKNNLNALKAFQMLARRGPSNVGLAPAKSGRLCREA